MTSVMRSYAQVPARIKYFLCVDQVNYAIRFPISPFFDYYSAIQLPTYPGPILTRTEFNAAYTDPSGYVTPAIAVGDQLKDLGQQFIITDANFNHRAIYRRVQRVRGIDSEGVGGEPPGWDTFYVKTWDADASESGYPVSVVRTG
jgi:hypothetical protein